MLGALSDPVTSVAILEVLIGLVLLTKAADVFVDGAVGWASSTNISPVVVGAVVVGFGTSAPELLVSGIAAVNGDVALGVGNVIGSNVANLSLVLGAAALIVPILVTRSVLAREAPLSLLGVLIFAYFTIDGFARWEGIVMMLLLVAALSWIIFGSSADSVQEFDVDDSLTLRMSVLMTSGGLVGTLAGAQLVVWGASAIADRFGLSGGFIGFTLVAIGTSLPELVTAIAAARKGETELILGNLLGSNLFNSLAVGGLIAVVGAGPIGDGLLERYGVTLMVVVAVLAWVFMVGRKQVSHVEALILLSVYAAAILLLSDSGMAESVREFLDVI